ncbi:MAG: ribulose-phosphate 3-epimerase [Planctomycetota bacterium]
MPHNLLTTPPHLPLVAPSILSADFATLARDARQVLDAGADLLHVDIMDGHFVPNLTMGPALLASLRGALPDAFFDVHLMVCDPAQYLEPFAKAGADHITFNIEPALDPRAGTGASPVSAGFDPVELMARTRDLGMSAGFAINPGTPLDPVRAWLAEADMVLAMSVEPGFSGQAFMAEVLPKVQELRAALTDHQRLQMDGGLSPDTAPACREAGCDVLVAATAIFGAAEPDRAAQIAKIRG